MKNYISRFARIIYFPPFLAIAVAVAAVATLPTLNKVVDHRLAVQMAAAQNPECIEGNQICDVFGLGAPLEDIQLVYGTLDERSNLEPQTGWRRTAPDGQPVPTKPSTPLW